MSPTPDNLEARIPGAAAAVFALLAFDQAAIGIALPTIRADLQMSLVQSLWLVSAYWLAFAAFAATSGRTVDAYGIRPVVLAGALLSAVGAMYAATAQTAAAIICARAVQGTGAAILAPAAVAIIAAAPAERRARAFENHMGVAAALLATGVAAAGLLVRFVSWRGTFWPALLLSGLLGLLVLIVVVRPFASSPPAQQPRSTRSEPLALRGSLSWFFGLGGLVIATTQMPMWGWSSRLFQITFAAGVAFLIRFLTIEARSADPLLRSAILRAPAFFARNGAAFAAQFSLVSVFVFAPVYLQQVAGTTVLESTVALAPAGLALFAASVVRMRATDLIRNSALMPFAGAIHTIALAWLAVATQTHGGPLPPVALVLWGASLAIFAPATRLAIVGDEIAERRGRAAGAGLTATALGGCIGFTLAGACLTVTGNFATVYGATALAVVAASILDATRRTTARAASQSPGSLPNNVR